MSFVMAVALMMFIKVLRRNGGDTAATTENCHLPKNFFLAFFAELYIFESFETSSLINIIKATATPKLTVTHFLAELLHWF